MIFLLKYDGEKHQLDTFLFACECKATEDISHLRSNYCHHSLTFPLTLHWKHYLPKIDSVCTDDCVGVCMLSSGMEIRYFKWPNRPLTWEISMRFHNLEIWWLLLLESYLNYKDLAIRVKYVGNND